MRRPSHRAPRRALAGHGVEPHLAAIAPAAVARGVSGGGRPLDPDVRDAMGAQLGFAFDRVRIHADDAAAEAAATLGARAFTYGRHVVFGRDEYRPESARGAEVLAHELGHVVHQSTTAPEVQRLAIGAGTGPVNADGHTLIAPPVGDRKRVEAAVARVAHVAEHPGLFPRCHEYARTRCPGNRRDALQDAFRRAVLWKLPPSAPDNGAGAVAQTGGTNMYYTQRGYDAGEETLAAYLMHELLHICGIGGGDEHHLADVARLYCMGAGRNEIGVRVSVGSEGQVGLLLGYRRLLRSWLSGRQQLRAGVDIDLVGLLREAGERDRPAELASATVGLQERVNPWGGERWGGLTLSADIGLGVDRFRVRAVRPDDPPQTKIAPGFILQAGARAEFYFPDLQGREGRRFGVTVEAAYRLVQPITREANQIHEVVVGVGVPF